MGPYLHEYWSDHFQIFNKYKRRVSNRIAFFYFDAKRKIHIYGKIKVHIFPIL